MLRSRVWYCSIMGIRRVVALIHVHRGKNWTPMYPSLRCDPGCVREGYARTALMLAPSHMLYPLLSLALERLVTIKILQCVSTN